MTMTWLLALYCLLILFASLSGGWIPHAVRLTHKRMEIAVSSVGGFMLGVGMLHMLPHSLEAITPHVAATWVLVGFLGMFLLERFFCFHHHDAPTDEAAGGASVHGDHGHQLTWTGAAVGLTIHSLVAGAALAASVEYAGAGGTAGLAVFLVIVLHKPFDSLTLGTLMVIAGGSARARHVVNGLFALAVPAGVLLFHIGLGQVDVHHAQFVAAALAFSTGTFLCIAMSDLLPELQFHQHDRVKLTVALFAGILLAAGIAMVEVRHHGPEEATSGGHAHHRHTSHDTPPHMAPAKAGQDIE